MKKYILIFVLFGGIILPGFSQSKILLPKETYSEMKANGQLKPDVEYILINDSKPENVQSAHITEEYVQHLEHNKTPTSGCSCLIPLDPTFTVAQFTSGSSPDYRNDDGSTASKTIPFNFCLYGTNYNHVYINTNGNVSFGSSYSTYSSTGFPDNSYVMVAPFWADVDTRDPSSGLVYYKITPTYMIVKWEAVGYYNSQADLLNTFQLIITNGTDPILPNGNNIAFCYGDMQWTTGSASGGSNGFGGTAATVGINKGDGVNYVQLGRFDQAGVAYDGGYGLEDGISWLDNQSFYFNSCGSTNIAPIANGLNNCDTLKICGTGDTLILNGLFLAPEIGQTTTVTVNTNGTPDATVMNIMNGNSATAQVMVIASLLNAGTNIITFTATDDGTPVASTVVNVIVYVVTTGLTNFNPQITGDLDICDGLASTLSVTPTNYDSYVWNTGSTNTSISIDSSGQYWVTSTKNGCSKTNLVDVTVNPLPTPVIAGYPYACNAGVTNLTVDSLIYSSYQWSNTSTNDSVTVGAGTYIVSVTDSNGCVGSSPAVMVTAPVPPVITGITAVCNGALAELTTTLQYASYNWSNSSTNDSITVSPGTYSVTVIDVNGCTIASTPINVSSFNYSLSLTGNHPFCTGQSLTLAAIASPTSGASYQWSTGASTSSIPVNTGGNYSVTLLYPNGCTADTTVTVIPPSPVPSPVISGYPFTCSGGTTTITVDSLIYASYQWSTTSTNDSITVGAGTYLVTVTDMYGCVGTSPMVTVTPAVSPVITGITALCNGDSALLTTTFPYVNYVWSTFGMTDTLSTTDSSSVYTGTYMVTVTDVNGCVLPSPPFSVTIFPFSLSATGVQPYCVNDSITLSATGNPSTGANYLWSTGDTTSLLTVNAGGSYTVTLVYENGCSADTTLEVANPSPLPTPVISGYPYTCAGGTTTITVDSLIYNTYSWSTTSTNDSITVGGGTYSVVVSDINGCIGISPAVTVIPAIQPVITGLPFVCDGDSTELTTVIPYVDYVWSTFGMTDTLSTTDSVSVLSGIYVVTVTDINGCILPSQPYQVLTFNSSFSASGIVPYCIGNSISISAIPNQGTVQNYSWNTTPVQTTPSISVNTGGNYTVNITFLNGCSTDTTLIVPNPNPLPTPVITGSLQTCGTTPTTLSFNPSYSSNIWSDLSTGSTISALNGTYYVTATDALGCVGTSPSVTVINSSPTVSISGNQQFCPYDSIPLVAQTSSVVGSYLWSNSATAQSTFVDAPGTYSVAIIDSYGCPATNSVIVTQYVSPMANFTSSPLGTANSNTIVNFSDLSSVTSPETVTGWIWDFGDNIGDSGPNPAHTYTMDGVFPVTLVVISNNGCKDTVSIDYNVISDIQIPNVVTPNNGGASGLNQYFYIKNLGYFAGTSLKVYNRWGFKVYESNDYQNDFKGENHPNGVYYYVLAGDKLKEPVYGFFQIIR